MTYLAMDGECAGTFIKVDGMDAQHLLRLLDVAAVCADGETHEVARHTELFTVCRPWVKPRALPMQANV